MLSLSKRVEELELELYRMKQEVRASRSRWEEAELDICEIAMEFCQKYGLQVPERISKRMGSHF